MDEYDYWFCQIYKLNPKDSDMIKYLKGKIESENFSLPRWRVHEVDDFCDYRPQELSERYDAARDGNWYFITPIIPVRTANSVWKKATDVHQPMDRRVFNEADGKLLGFKFCFEFLDENNQEWRMCLYRGPDLVNRKLSDWTFGKIYKHIEEEEEGYDEDEEVPDDEDGDIYIGSPDDDDDDD